MSVLSPLEKQTMREVADHACALASQGRAIVFTAAILHNNRVIARTRNEVDETDDVSRHAEVVAISHAARVLRSRDLSGATLVASCQPCEMCLAAMRWAGIARVIFGAQKSNLPSSFFRFPGLELEDFLGASSTHITALGGFEEDRLLPIYRKDPK